MSLPPGWARKAARVAVDLVAPLLLYYVLRAAGTSVYTALLASTLLSAASGVGQLVVKRHVDELSAYLTVMLLGSLVIALVSGSERFLLAKGAVLTGVSGLWFIGSLAARRPLAFVFSKPLLEGRLGWPGSWDELWEGAPAFRRMWRVSSVLWGIGGLVDAGLRVWMAYHLVPDTVPALGNVLYVATTVVLVVVTNVYYFACGIHDRRSALYLPWQGSPDERARA